MGADSTPNIPTNAMYHGRSQWPSETRRGVLIGDPDKVRIDAEMLEPRVVIRGDAKVEEPRDVVIRGDAKVEEPRDVLILGPFGTRSDWMTVTFKPSVLISTGCFHGTPDAFRKEVEMKEQGDPHRVEYEAALLLIQAVAAVRAT